MLRRPRSLVKVAVLWSGRAGRLRFEAPSRLRTALRDPTQRAATAWAPHVPPCNPLWHRQGRCGSTFDHPGRGFGAAALD